MLSNKINASYKLTPFLGAFSSQDIENNGVQWTGLEQCLERQNSCIQ